MNNPSDNESNIVALYRKAIAAHKEFLKDAREARDIALELLSQMSDEEIKRCRDIYYDGR